MTTSSNPHDHLDQDLLKLSDDLDTLARHDRAQASASMEDRLFMATRSTLGTPAPTIHEAAPRLQSTPARWRIWAPRIAAMLAVVVGGWVVFNSRSTVNSVESGSDIDSLLAAMEAVDSVSDNTRDLQLIAGQLGLIQATIAGDFFETPVSNEQENL